MRVKKGDIVKMSDLCKQELIKSGCTDHLEEFGECEGIVGENVFDDTKDFVNVYWQPSNLVYGYRPTKDLVKLPKGESLIEKNQLIAKHTGWRLHCLDPENPCEHGRSYVFNLYDSHNRVIKHYSGPNVVNEESYIDFLGSESRFLNFAVKKIQSLRTHDTILSYDRIMKAHAFEIISPTHFPAIIRHKAFTETEAIFFAVVEFFKYIDKRDINTGKPIEETN